MEATDLPASSSLSLDDIRQIPEPQFQQQLLNWMQTTDVSQRLQAKLRADLFNSFNATTLGRRMAAAAAHPIHPQPGALLPSASPLLLALNTLAAEFLYTQNCQFTLSVLATESPHRNTLPDFAGATTPFRFSRRQIDQLLTSMMMGSDGAPYLMGEKKHISKAYEMSLQTESVNSSLLFMLCQTLMATNNKKLRTVTAEGSTQTRSTEFKNTSFTKSRHYHKCSRNSVHYDGLLHATENDHHQHQMSSASKKNHRPLQAYIQLFTAHLERLTDSISEFSKSATADNNNITFSRNLTKLCHRLHRFARRRPKIAHKMQYLAKAVSRLTVKLERCLAGVLAQIEKPVATAIPERQSTNSIEVTYSDWVLQLKHSRHGRRFLEQLKTHHREVTQRDAERQRTEWELKFQQERRLMKLHYKQRLLERYRDLLAGASGSTAGGGGAIGGDVEQVQKSNLDVLTDRLDGNGRVVAKPKRPLHSELSSQKLPDLNITPETEHHNVTTTRPVYNSHVELNETNARIEELDAASEAIEQTVQQRLQEHTAERRKHIEQQKRIQHQSFVGKQLIGGATSTLKVMSKHRYRMDRTVYDNNASDEVRSDDAVG